MREMKGFFQNLKRDIILRYHEEREASAERCRKRLLQRREAAARTDNGIYDRFGNLPSETASGTAHAVEQAVSPFTGEEPEGHKRDWEGKPESLAEAVEKWEATKSRRGGTGLSVVFDSSGDMIRIEQPIFTWHDGELMAIERRTCDMPVSAQVIRLVNCSAGIPD